MTGFINPDATARCALLRGARNIAVIGLSPNPARPSYRVSAGMQRHGFTIIPVRPGVTEVLGARAYARLSDVPDRIDLVDVFRSSEFVDGIVDECIALRLPALWLQDGVVNEPAALRAVAAGITVVMDRCVHRDWVRECQ